jgi:hypothetical protein
MRVYLPDVTETPDECDQAGQAIPPALERIVIATEQEDLVLIPHKAYTSLHRSHCQGNLLIEGEGLASVWRIAAGIILADRDQLQAQVAYPDPQAVQRSLVGDWT